MRVAVGFLDCTLRQPFHIVMIVTLAILSLILLVALLFGCVAICASSMEQNHRKIGESSTRLHVDEEVEERRRGIGNKKKLGRSAERYDVMGMQHRGGAGGRGEVGPGVEETRETFRKIDEVEAGTSKG